MGVAVPGQEILARSSVVLTDDGVELRFTAGLPAQGRRILAREAETMLFRAVPKLVQEALVEGAQRVDVLRRHLDVAEDGDALRRLLPTRGLVAFVADGAVLPRESGVNDGPLSSGAVPFESPESLRVSVTLPNCGEVAGMGIASGITLIVGGGYHGKSTLLNALEWGVYDHVPGDGRELVVTDGGAVKIRAEDGRRVEGVDLTPFIRDLPGGADPSCFRTDNASGSTSQAANIVEALEQDASVLLLDEDTSATNLMIRDARMQALIEHDGEPITPFLDRVQSLSRDAGVSTILVLGGCGDYFDVADVIVRMAAFRAVDVTGEAKKIAAELSTGRRVEAEASCQWREHPGCVDTGSLNPSRGRREVSVRSHALRSVTYGDSEVDMTLVAQVVDDAQMRAIGQAMEAFRVSAGSGSTMAEVISGLMDRLHEQGLSVLGGEMTGDMAEFRRFELSAALNRLRTLRTHRVGGELGRGVGKLEKLGRGAGEGRGAACGGEIG